uniref:holo-[acyl-carrier-protein] synthase n=1 Tax=Amphidinium carterae TaxID=2961 RepID=A0A977XV19_AMPCA|nr:phosphopantetheinyl transferase [Amphidinium carterae]
MGSSQAAQALPPADVTYSELWESPVAPASGWGEASDGRWRWAVDVHSWLRFGSEDCEEFQNTLRLLPEADRDAVLRQQRWLDMKRTLLSRILARRACAKALGIDSFAGFEISRTYGGKPFLSRPLPDRMPNFNFNISHDGRWLILASDPLKLIGVDVAAPQLERGEGEDLSFISDLESMLFESEKAAIRASSSEIDQYATFQRLWSAKEAITKALGWGIDFDVSRIEVHLDPHIQTASLSGVLELLGLKQPSCDKLEANRNIPKAEASIDWWPRPDWELQQACLPGGHWVTVALGSVEEAVDRNGDFSKTLRLRGAANACLPREPEVPPAFEQLTVEALLPMGIRQHQREAVATS